MAPENSSLVLQGDHVSEVLYDEFLEATKKPRTNIYSSRCFYAWGWAGQLVLFFTSIFIAFRGSTGPNCVEKLSNFSPALAAVSEDYVYTRFNSTIFGGSPYTGKPSPELDERWDALIHLSAFSVSPEDLLRLGGSPDSVQLPAESGGGYMGWLEHTLWQNTWPDYYNTTEMGSQDINSTYRKHIDHCADNLRQKLMCTADVGIITFDWLKKYKDPIPNFNTVHKCRNLDAIGDWHAAHRAPKKGTDLRKTPDSVVYDHLP